MEVQYVFVLDLTTIFGSGNEPSAKEVDVMLAKFTNSWFDGTVNPFLNLKEALTYANKNKANIAQEAWITPTFVNSWVNFDGGYNLTGYYKDSLGIVHIKGRAKSGAAGTTIFSLPAGYRPSAMMAVASEQGGLFVQIQILSTGEVKPIGSATTSISLDNIHFKAEA
jgi:hypothetical protein